MSHHHHLIPGSPAEFGPGTWWILHLTAYRVDTTDKIPEFINFLHYIAANIPCLMCRHHAADYLHANNGSKYFDQNYENRHIGMFVWMSDFHNSVNKRNNKRVVPWLDAYSEYKKENERWIEEQVNGLAEINELQVGRNLKPIRLHLAQEIMANHPNLFPSLDNKQTSFNQKEEVLRNKETELNQKETSLNQKEEVLRNKETELNQKEIMMIDKLLNEKNAELKVKNHQLSRLHQQIEEAQLAYQLINNQNMKKSNLHIRYASNLL